MTQELEALERRIEKLRAEVRRAVAGGDRDRARGLRAELRASEREWDKSLDLLEADQAAAPTGAGAAGRPSGAEVADGSSGAGRAAGPGASGRGSGGGGRGSGGGGGALLPAREQVHQALTLLGGPAAPRLIVEVHDAFYAGSLHGARLTSLRRDEERSFRSAPYARPYYLCAALTADLLAPARGLLAISTWSLDRRVIGPLSPRVDFLNAAIRVAQRFQGIQDFSDVSANARRLLWRFAANIPRAAANISTMNPGEIVKAAQAELAVHELADSELRTAAARRARDQLDDIAQLFGTGLQLSRHSSG